MDLARIKRLLAIVAASDVAEVEIEEDGLKIVVRKSAPTYMMPPPVPYASYGVYAVAPPGSDAGAAGGSEASAGVAPAAVPVNATPHQAPGPSAAAPGPGPAAPEPVHQHLVRAPIVGTFFRAPAPDSEPFVQAGDRVSPGDVLCIIEAMKLMNEIESEVSGVLRRILVQNAEPVEYDQPLFVIEGD